MCPPNPIVLAVYVGPKPSLSRMTAYEALERSVALPARVCGRSNHHAPPKNDYCRPAVPRSLFAPKRSRPGHWRPGRLILQFYR